MTTTSLTDLQEKMDALAALKCPKCRGTKIVWIELHDEARSPFKADCPTCNGTGLKREYDVLRVECRGVDLYDQGARYHDLVDSATEGGTLICGCGGKLYTTLPAERCDEAVGKLLASFRMDLEYQGEGWPGLWAITRGVKDQYGDHKSIFSDTPEKALINARCEMEGVSSA